MVDIVYPILGVLVIAILSFFLILFFYQGQKWQQNAPYLRFAVVFGILGQILALFGRYSETVIILIGANLIVLAFFFLYLHYENLAALQPRLYSFTTLIILLSFSCGTFLFSELGSEEAGYTLSYEFTRFITLFASLLALYWCFRIIYKVHRLAKERTTLIEVSAIFLMLVSRIIYAIQSIFIILNKELSITKNETFSLFIENSLMVIALILISIGMSVLFFNYIVHPDYIYRLPFPIHSIMLYNSNGLPIYTRNVQSHHFQDFSSDSLISGMLSAITGFIQEVLGAEARIRHINAQEYHIFFAPLPEESGAFVVIASGATAYFQKSLQRFTKSMNSNFLKKIRSDIISKREEELFPVIDDLIKQAFPYLRLNAEK